MASMNGKVAVVVGGAKGIGLAIARRLAQEGATVILTGRRADEVAECITQIRGGECGTVLTDLHSRFAPSGAREAELELHVVHAWRSVPPSDDHTRADGARERRMVGRCSSSSSVSHGRKGTRSDSCGASKTTCGGAG